MQGLRGQLRTGSLLTGQLYVALDMFPKAPRASVDVRHTPVELPTVPNTLDELQVQIADIAHKLDQAPFDRIGNNLNGALAHANQLFGHLDEQVAAKHMTRWPPPNARSTRRSRRYGRIRRCSRTYMTRCNRSRIRSSR